MDIMRYKESDTEEIVSLFYDTVHSVNAIDYSQLQIDAWAPKAEKETRVNTWRKSLGQHITYVVKVNNHIVGFSDLTYSGHLDRLYVHKDYQGQGIATALVTVLESEARRLNLLEIDTEASITARPFFEHQGYNVVCSQTVERKGIKLTNFKMSKKL